MIIVELFDCLLLPILFLFTCRDDVYLVRTITNDEEYKLPAVPDL